MSSPNMALKPLAEEKKRILPDGNLDTSDRDTKDTDSDKIRPDPDKTHPDPDKTHPEYVAFNGCQLKMSLSTVNTLLFTLMTMSTLQHPGGVSALQDLLLREDPALKDTVFTNPPLFLSNTPYLLDCAALCLTFPNCLTLTFNSGPPPPLCQGHAELMTSHSPGLPTKGTRTFIFGNVSTWAEKPCIVSGTDCTVTNSECFMGRCVCTPGYYYSHSQDACVPTCATADLQNGYMMYPGSVIWAYNLKTTKVVTLNQCKLLCLADTRCRDLDFDYNADTCYMHSVTPLTVSVSYWRDIKTADFFQRTCA